MGTTAVLLLESLRSPRIEHLRSITTSHAKWQKIQYSAENFVFLVVQGFWTRSSCSTSLTSHTSLSQDNENFIVSGNNAKWEYEWTSTRRPVTNPVTGRRRARETRYRLNCHEKRCNRKRIHTHFLRPKLRHAGGPELLGLYARDAQVKPYFEQQNLGELITAEHKVLIETCELGNKTSWSRQGSQKSFTVTIPWSLA